jgi:hypothetical protein
MLRRFMLLQTGLKRAHYRSQRNGAAPLLPCFHAGAGGGCKPCGACNSSIPTLGATAYQGTIKPAALASIKSAIARLNQANACCR